MQYCVCGYNGIARTSDLVTWDKIADARDFYEVARGIDRYVVCGNNRSYVLIDGQAAQYYADIKHPLDVIFYQGKFWRTTNQSNKIQTSVDGFTWADITIPLGSLSLSIKASEDIIVVSGVGRICYSLDAGATWTMRSSPASSTNAIWRLALDGSRLLLNIGYGELFIAEPPYSSWQTVIMSTATTDRPTNAASAKILVKNNTIIIPGLNTTNRYLLSKDAGATWTVEITPLGSGYSGIVNNGGFIVAHASGTPKLYQYDIDGENPVEIADLTSLKINARYIAQYEPIVSTPTISPPSQSSRDPITVTITCATDGATIRYTLDGTDPTEDSPIYPSGGDSGTVTLFGKTYSTAILPDSTVRLATNFAHVVPGSFGRWWNDGATDNGYGAYYTRSELSALALALVGTGWRLDDGSDQSAMQVMPFEPPYPSYAEVVDMIAATGFSVEPVGYYDATNAQWVSPNTDTGAVFISHRDPWGGFPERNNGWQLIVGQFMNMWSQFPDTVDGPILPNYPPISANDAYSVRLIREVAPELFAITIDHGTVTVKARAYSSGLAPSAVASETYEITRAVFPPEQRRLWVHEACSTSGHPVPSILTPLERETKARILEESHGFSSEDRYSVLLRVDEWGRFVRAQADSIDNIATHLLVGIENAGVIYVAETGIYYVGDSFGTGAVYLSQTVPGAFTTTKPASGIIQRVGSIIGSALFLNIRTEEELELREDMDWLLGAASTISFDLGQAQGSIISLQGGASALSFSLGELEDVVIDLQGQVSSLSYALGQQQAQAETFGGLDDLFPSAVGGSVHIRDNGSRLSIVRDSYGGAAFADLDFMWDADAGYGYEISVRDEAIGSALEEALRDYWSLAPTDPWPISRVVGHANVELGTKLYPIGLYDDAGTMKVIATSLTADFTTSHVFGFGRISFRLPPA